MGLLLCRENNSDAIDLRGGDDGFYLARDGWVPKIAEQDDDGNYQNPVEALTLHLAGTSHNNIAAQMQAVRNLLNYADEYRRFHYADQRIFLNDQLDDESGGRYALVVRGRIEPGVSLHGPPTSPGDYVDQVTLTLERKPFWEDVGQSLTESFTIAQSGSGAHIGSPATGWSINGDVSARISALTINTSSALSEYWIGFRKNHRGITSGLFEPEWECENGTASTDTSIDSDSANCTFATDTSMTTRLSLSIDDVTAFSSFNQHQAGRHLVLLRARSTGTHTYRVRLLNGMAYNDQWVKHHKVAVPASGISSGFWYLYPLGYIDIPLDYHTGISDDEWETYTLMLQAERVTSSGTGNLEMDKFILVPVNDGFIYARDKNSNTTEAVIYHEADDRIVGVGYSATDAVAKLELTPIHYGLPTGDARVIAAGQSDTQHSTAYDISMTLRYYERWLGLRGSESI